MMKTFLILLMTFLLTSCNRNTDLFLKDVVVTDRFYSPDSSYVALIYYVDNGAMGNSRSMANVLKVGDTLGSLDKGRLPCNKDLAYNSCYFPKRWIDGKTLEVTLQEVAFVKSGLPFDSTGITVNGIDCKVVLSDDSRKRPPLIKQVSFSDDRKKILVVYEYTGDLNISAIVYGDKLPKYGNLVTIPSGNFNPIQYAIWRGDNIDMYMKDAEMFEPSNYINKGVVYTINFVDVSKLKKVPVDSVLYEDPWIDSLLKEKGITTKGVITDNTWRMADDKSVFDYQYRYGPAGQRFRSHFRIFKNFKDGPGYKSGDSIEVVYDPKAVFIHTDKVSK